MLADGPSLLRTTLFRNVKLVVRRSPLHRWGVFAWQPIEPFELLEEAPYVAVPQAEIELAPACEIYSYGLNNGHVAVGFGFAALYNHSGEANCDYELDRVNEVMRHYATRRIEAGEELTLDYGEENVIRYGLAT